MSAERANSELDFTETLTPNKAERKYVNLLKKNDQRGQRLISRLENEIPFSSLYLFVHDIAMRH